MNALLTGGAINVSCNVPATPTYISYPRCMPWSTIPGSAGSVFDGVVSPSTMVYLPAAPSAGLAFNAINTKVLPTDCLV